MWMTMTKDWTGNRKSTYTTLGASSHTNHERAENDYYATEPRCMSDLLSLDLGIYNVWECACGEGHLANVLNIAGVLGRASDLIDRNYGEHGVDFLTQSDYWDGWIVTNPPYRYALEFCKKAIELSPNVAMFLKLTFLEGQERFHFFKEYPPKYVYVYSSRRICALNGDFESISSGASAYAWFIWEKGYKGDTVIRWIL